MTGIPLALYHRKRPRHFAADRIGVDAGKVLEAGCGVGAQTVTLAKNNPAALITAVDFSDNSLVAARLNAEAAGVTNVIFHQADIFNLPFELNSFDHIFVCFVLEHLSHPANGLTVLKKYLKIGGTLTVIEGDHGSTYFFPDGSLMAS